MGLDDRLRAGRIGRRRLSILGMSSHSSRSPSFFDLLIDFADARGFRRRDLSPDNKADRPPLGSVELAGFVDPVVMIDIGLGSMEPPEVDHEVNSGRFFGSPAIVAHSLLVTTPIVPSCRRTGIAREPSGAVPYVCSSR